MEKITKGTIINHYSCGNMVSGEVVFVGGNKIVTRHEPQISIMGEKRTHTPIEWCNARNKPLPLAYIGEKMLTKNHFELCVTDQKESRGISPGFKKQSQNKTSKQK